MAELICEDVNYIVSKGDFLKLVKLSRNGAAIKLGRTSVNVDTVLNHPVGSLFKLMPARGRSRHCDAQPVTAIDDLSADVTSEQSVEDNRHLVASAESQSLSRDDIDTMKEQGASGRQIVSSIVENSATFDAKTEFSQEKYVRKKQKKYFEFISVQRPSIRLLARMYYMQDPLKILNLRVDSLSQLLTSCSLGSGRRCLVLETGAQGLCVAAVLQRVAPAGLAIHAYHGARPQRQAVSAMNFSHSQLASLVSIEVASLARLIGDSATAGADATDQLPAQAAAPVGVCSDDCGSSNGDSEPIRRQQCDQSSDETETDRLATTGRHADMADEAGQQTEMSHSEPARKRQKVDSEDDEARAVAVLRQRSLDAFIMCTRHHPVNMAVSLLDFLHSSRPFAIFSPYKEPLTECYFALKARGCVLLKLSETWLRHYQVLPERTHPEVNMSGGGGFILTGYKIERSSQMAHSKTHSPPAV